MTVDTVIVRHAYIGGVGQVDFDYDFKIYTASDIEVYVEGVLTTSGFTVSGVGNDNGGTVTFTESQDNKNVVLVSQIAGTQLLDLVRFGAFDAENVEEALDKVTRLTLQNNDGVNRSIRVNSGDPLPAPSFTFPETLAERANKILSFDGAGDSVEAVNSGPIGTILVRGTVTGTDNDNPVSDVGVKQFVEDFVASNIFTPIKPIRTAYLTAGSGTHTFNVNTSFYEIREMIGAGGGGGGGAPSAAQTGGPGAAGGESLGYFAKTSASASYSVGAAGTKGASGAAGSAGDNTTWDDGTVNITCNGGAGGAAGDDAEAAAAGGTATGGEENKTGRDGGVNGLTSANDLDADGADSSFGVGGKFNVNAKAGKDATGHGAGGAGGRGNGTTAEEEGGDGSPGKLVVIEYGFNTVAELPAARQVKKASTDGSRPLTITGAIDDVNDLFTLPASYVAGSLMVYVGPKKSPQLTFDFTETDPVAGTFTLGVPPKTTNPGTLGPDEVTVEYDEA